VYPISFAAKAISGIALFLILLASFFAPLGCATVGQAETPAQKYYAAKSLYAITLQVAVEYARTPTADPSVIFAIAEGDQEAARIFREMDVFLATNPDNHDRALEAADALVALTERLRRTLIEAGALDETSSLPEPGYIPLARAFVEVPS
jgi:hypothetical protein